MNRFTSMCGASGVFLCLLSWNPIWGVRVWTAKKQRNVFRVTFSKMSKWKHLLQSFNCLLWKLKTFNGRRWFTQLVKLSSVFQWLLWCWAPLGNWLNSSVIWHFSWQPTENMGFYFNYQTYHRFLTNYASSFLVCRLARILSFKKTDGTTVLRFRPELFSLLASLYIIHFSFSKCFYLFTVNVS